MMESNTLLTILFIDIPILLFIISKEMDKLYLQTRFFGALLIKLVNDNINDYNGHMSTILFSYQTTYTVKTCHTPF